jgi:hypothetical protein
MHEALIDAVADRAGIDRMTAQRLLLAVDSPGKWKIVHRTDSRVWGAKMRLEQVKWVQKRTGLDAEGAEQLVELIDRSGYRIRRGSATNGDRPSKSIRTVAGGGFESSRRRH